MRGVLRRVLRGAALAAVLLALWSTGCEDPTGAVTGITGVSAVFQPDGHFHRATVPLSDVENPPVGGRDYASTVAAGHSHVVHLSQQQLGDLQQPNALVSVTSQPATRPGDTSAHDHLFTFTR